MLGDPDPGVEVVDRGPDVVADPGTRVEVIRGVLCDVELVVGVPRVGCSDQGRPLVEAEG